MRRTTLGILAILLLVVGFIVAWRGPEDGSAAGLAGGCVRVGLVLGALWLALPQITALAKGAPGWLLGWFVRGKPGDKPPADGEPRPPVKRPRRRSQAR